MTSDSSPRPARWTVLAAFVFALSWLLPNHHEPWVDFYSDAWAALALWCVGAAVFWRSSRLLTRMAWHMLPILALGCFAIVWVQYTVGLVESFGVAWISSL